MPFIRNGTSEAFNVGAPRKSGAQLFSKQAAPAHRGSRGLQTVPRLPLACTDASIYICGENPVYSEPIIQVPPVFCSEACAEVHCGRVSHQHPTSVVVLRVSMKDLKLTSHSEIHVLFAFQTEAGKSWPCCCLTASQKKFFPKFRSS